MCTALTLKTNEGEHLFGRNMDLEYTFGQSPVLVPRNFEYRNMANGRFEKTKNAILGMATIVNNHPLFAEALNEKGLACAGLNFPEARWDNENVDGKYNMPPYDLILWITSNFETVEDVREQLCNVNLVGKVFAENMPLPTLHWMVTDKTGKSIVIEKTEDDFKVVNNPVGVMTNAPSFDWHLTNLQRYMGININQPKNVVWSDLELAPLYYGAGGIGLPGDFSSPSRFTKVAFLKTKSITEDKEDSGVTEFFHILDSVAMVRGSVLTPDGINDITQYSSCMNQDRGLYYYKTYNNNTITVIDMNKENLDCNELKIYKYNDVQNFKCEN